MSNRNCLCYLIQYLEQKSALPLIRFWLDVESFKSSAEQCGHQQQHCTKVSNRLGHRQKPAIGRSISLDGIALNRDDFCHAFHQQNHDDDTLLNAIGNSTLSSSNEFPERDNGDGRPDGDGSSNANSISDLSDIYERNDDDQLDALSMGNEYGSTGGGGGGFAQKIFENGRKSATGASSHDGGADNSEYDTKSGTITSKFATSDSIVIDAIRIFQKYLLEGELTRLIHIPTAILSQISLVLCCRPSDDNSNRMGHQLQPSTSSNLSISNESLALSTNDGAIEEKTLITVFDDAQTYILDHLDEMYCAEFLGKVFMFLGMPFFLRKYFIFRDSFLFIVF